MTAIDDIRTYLAECEKNKEFTVEDFVKTKEIFEKAVNDKSIFAWGTDKELNRLLTKLHDSIIAASIKFKENKYE